MSLTNTVNYRNDIDQLLGQYVDSIKRQTACNLNSEAVNAEGFFRNLLNLIYDFNLSKEKIESATNDTIDLHNIENRICVQVTANNTKTKIDKTIESFIHKKKYNEYSHLHFLIIDRNKSFKYEENKLSNYSVEIKFHDCTTILQELINNFDSFSKIKPVWDFVVSELRTKEYKKEKTRIETTIPIIKNSFIPNIELHLIDQILEYIKLFEGFAFIHPRLIARLPIFNDRSDYHDSYSHYCLKTSNKAIYELLQKIQIKNTEVIIRDPSLKAYEEKLKKIFLTLNNSLISCICYREKYTEIEHFDIRIENYDDNCNCLYCQFHNYKVETLFIRLKEKTIIHSENLSEALAESYYLCKLGEQLQGWKILNSVAEKSKTQNNIVIHFLSLYNIKQIRNFINAPWWRAESKQILPRIDSIDLYNTINEFPITYEIREELIKLKENYYLHWSREIIDEQFERILATKVLYENGGTNWGSNTISLLENELYILFFYYSKNHIIEDDFYTFKQIITKGVEGLLISFTTDRSYEYRFKEFNIELLSFMYLYVEEKKLENLFNKYKILHIPIIESNKHKFIDKLVNYFTFQYNKGIWNSITFNSDISKQDYFSSYRQNLRSIFNKIMLLLSKVELSTEELKPLTEPFIDYLRVTENSNSNNWTYIVTFLKSKIQIFSKEQIKAIIELTLTDNHHNNGVNVFEKLCNLAYEKTHFVLTTIDSDYLEKLYNQISIYCNKYGRSYYYELFLASWCIVDEIEKNKIKQKCIEYLNIKFDTDFYMSAVFKDVFTKNDNLIFLDNFINSTLENCSSSDIEYKNGRWEFQNLMGVNCINCLAYLKVDFNQKDMQDISKKSDYYNWLINYDNYDYTNFNLSWLTELFTPYYIKVKLREIESLKEKVRHELMANYDSKLAEYYTKYLI